jgi:GNAT superfamily N-acetyltransferase
MAQPPRGLPRQQRCPASATSDHPAKWFQGTDRSGAGQSAKLTAIDVALLSRTPAHAPKAVALLERYLRLPDAWPRGAPAVLPPAFQALLRSFPGAACPPSGEVLMATSDDDNVIGQVLLVRHDDYASRLERMYVVKESQRQGVATQLLDAAVAHANVLGYRRVVLDVLADRSGAIRLYEAHGFAPIKPYADYDRPMVFLGRDV